MKKFVMTTFYPYQWDLNYWNPVVMNEMVYNMLNLTNKGIDVIRIDAVPYIWKQLGTNCRNLPQVHNIVRMMRMICEIVCPGVLLLGEVVMEPEKVVPYFGSVEKPECHMLYNVTTMATTWNTVATRDARLLRQQMDIINRLPKDYVFLNYLRCHDDIGWGLDYGWLGQFGINEVAHKKYLSDFFTGKYENSFARGELYNADPASGDARQCGTTASLCGIEKAAYEKDEEATKRAIRYDLTLHAYMLTQSGIPVIYSGDEIGQENDYTYHEDPKKWGDSRYLHRGDFQWDKAELRHTKGTIPGEMFEGLSKLETIRKSHPVFESTADCRTVDTWDDSILGLIKEKNGEKLVALFNFSEYDKVAWINEEDGMYEDLISGRQMEARGVQIPAFGCYSPEKIGVGMTISEIAKLAGVSSAAVSRYLNDGSLSQEKRQRIERVIRETKYRPSEYARTMRTKKSNRIGVLVPQIDSESVPKILSGISERMDQKNYHVLLMNSNLSLEKEIGILETFEQSQVDGLIFVASVLTKRHEKALEHMGVPVVILGQKSEKYPCIYHDDEGAACAMMEELLKSGCRRPAYIGVEQVG